MADPSFSKALVVHVNKNRVDAAMALAHKYYDSVAVYDCNADDGIDASQFDAIIFCSPEWNGSVPWQIKKFIDDQPYKSFRNKTAHFVVYSGGKNMANDLRASLLIMCHNLGMAISHDWQYIE